MTKNKWNILTASISLLFVRSKMAVCILNRKRDSLYPLTLQPADHFRTQNRTSVLHQVHWLLNSHQEQSRKQKPKKKYLGLYFNVNINVKPLPPSCDHKVSCIKKTPVCSFQYQCQNIQIIQIPICFCHIFSDKCDMILKHKRVSQ